MRNERKAEDYMPIPFWSWNDKLEPDELRRQIRNMKKAGIGGFFMHARGGLLTEYMGEDWMKAVEACIDEAEKQDMNAWCYDENGWPSGFAGMKLLNDKANFAYYLDCERADAFDPCALACYMLEDGCLRRVFRDEGAPCYCLYDRTNSSVVDVLNPDIVKKFIEETHEKYYARFGKDFGRHMLGFFTDEPQYFRWATAYTPMMLTMYRGRYGEDLLDDLGALFLDCDKSKKLRFRYWRLMNELFTENFAGQVYRWCEEHDCMLTGHAVEESSLFGQMFACAGVMPFYEYEHIPGVDWLGREIGGEATPRQVYSVAAQLGKKQVLTETFACAGWDVTPRELKRIAEWQYVNGVNLMCQHLYPYSIRGQRKRDYPAFYSEHNPWTVDFKYFNDYFSGLGRMLAESDEEAEVAVIHPMHSAYFEFKREDHKTLTPLETRVSALAERLGAANIGHQYIDECLLEKYGSVDGDVLVMGAKRYKYVVIPDMDGLDGCTVELLDEFLINGGMMWLQGKCPCFVDGLETELGYVSTVKFEDMINPNCRVSDMETSVRSTLRRSPDGDFLYAVNLDKEKSFAVDFSIKANGLSRLDVISGEKKPLYFVKSGDKCVLPLVFAPGDSYVIMLDNATSLPAPAAAPDMRELGVDFRIANADNNTLTIDRASLSYDGVNFGEIRPIMALSDELLRGRQNRTIYIKYKFRVNEKPESLGLECEAMGARSVKLNGEELSLNKGGEIDISNLTCDILRQARIGDNELIFEIDYYQTEQVYDVFNGVYYDRNGGTESLINCLSYITDIEAIYLRGDFRVEASLANGDKNTRISENGVFAIVPSENNVCLDALAQSGYPFFSGSMTFEKDVELSGTETLLKLNGRYAVAKAEICGETRIAMFGDTIDISGLCKPGKNTLRITLICARRNTLGPFHFAKDPEPYAVSPDLMSLYGTWQDGKSPQYADRYAFTFFGLTDISIG